MIAFVIQFFGSLHSFPAGLKGGGKTPVLTLAALPVLNGSLTEELEEMGMARTGRPALCQVVNAVQFSLYQ